MKDACENCGALLTQPPTPVADGGFNRRCVYCGAPNHEEPRVVERPRPEPQVVQRHRPQLREPLVQSTIDYPYLTVRDGVTLDRPDLTSLESYLQVSDGATLNAPALTRVGSYVLVGVGATLNAPVLTEIGSYLDVAAGATLDAPLLKRVALYVNVAAGATVNASLRIKARRVIVPFAVVAALLVVGGVTIAPSIFKGRGVAVGDLTTLSLDGHPRTLDASGMSGSYASFDPIANVPWAKKAATAWSGDAFLYGVDIAQATKDGVVPIGSVPGAKVEYSFASPSCLKSYKSTNARCDFRLVVDASDGNPLPKVRAEHGVPCCSEIRSPCSLHDAMAALDKAGRLPSQASYKARLQDFHALSWSIASNVVDATSCQVEGSGMVGTTKLTTEWQTVDVPGVPADTRLDVSNDAWVKNIAAKWSPDAVVIEIHGTHHGVDGIVGLAKDAWVEYWFWSFACAQSDAAMTGTVTCGLELLVDAPARSVRVRAAEYGKGTSYFAVGPTHCSIGQAFAALAKTTQLPAQPVYDVTLLGKPSPHWEIKVNKTETADVGGTKVSSKSLMLLGTIDALSCALLSAAQ